MVQLKKIARQVLPESFFSFINKYRKRNFDSANYWEKRYSKGGNSGPGSYKNLADFKAEVLNSFVAENNLRTVMEFGCGDGNQLTLAKYPEYVGIDVSSTAIDLCKKQFGNDTSKRFYVLKDYTNQTAELTLSLDVIYHLVEDHVFEDYIRRLFNASTRYVIIYSNDSDDPPEGFHVKPRKFTTFIEKNISGWTLESVVKTKFPYDPKNLEQTSWSDIFIYKKQ